MGTEYQFPGLGTRSGAVLADRRERVIDALCRCDCDGLEAIFDELLFGQIRTASGATAQAAQVASASGTLSFAAEAATEQAAQVASGTGSAINPGIVVTVVDTKWIGGPIVHLRRPEPIPACTGTAATVQRRQWMASVGYRKEFFCGRLVTRRKGSAMHAVGVHDMTRRDERDIRDIIAILDWAA